MKRITFFANILVLLLFISCKSTYKIPSQPATTSLAKDIIELSSDKYKGRETGKYGEQQAARYIVKRFTELGIQPKGVKGKFFQPFEKYDNNPHSKPDFDMPTDPMPTRGKNVIGYIDNNAPNTVVIGAHYDHLGMGTFGSLYTGPAEIHNGADDNASGVAVMLYMAEKLVQSGAKNNNYLFIAFSGEEKGLWGSNFFIKNPTIDIKSVNYMINFDMVGRLENNKLAINGTGTSLQWKVLDDANKKFELIKSESGFGPSDHTSFYLADIPSIHMFTGQHEDYHKPSDDADKINFKGCFEVAHYALDIIKRLDKKGRLDFQKTKDNTTTPSAFKVTLGVMPDYMFSGKGMRIDGVRQGKTADSAGILKGDVVIKMGDLEIVDMESYMKALGAFEKGQTIKVDVLRDNKKVTKSVTFK